MTSRNHRGHWERDTGTGHPDRVPPPPPPASSTPEHELSRLRAALMEIYAPTIAGISTACDCRIIARGALNGTEYRHLLKDADDDTDDD